MRTGRHGGHLSAERAKPAIVDLRCLNLFLPVRRTPGSEERVSHVHPARAEAPSAGQSLPENLRKQAKRLAKAEGSAPRRRAAPACRRIWPSHLGRPDARGRYVGRRRRCGRQPAVPGRCTRRRGRGPRAAGPGATRQRPQRRGQHAVVARLRKRCAGGSAHRHRPVAAGGRRIAACSSARTGRPHLHAAARSGPLALVEMLIRGGALSWQTDRHGKTALDYARAGAAPDRERHRRAARPARHPRSATSAPPSQRSTPATSMAWAGCSIGIPSCCACAPSSPTAIRRTISAIPSCSGSSPTIRPDAEGAGQHRRHRPGDDRAGRRAGRSRQHAGAGHQQQRRIMGGPAGRGARQTLLAAGATPTPQAIVVALAHWAAGAGAGAARPRHGDDGADRRCARPQR